VARTDKLDFRSVDYAGSPHGRSRAYANASVTRFGPWTAAPVTAATDGAEIGVQLGADRILRVHLRGTWHLGDGLPSTELVEQALRSADPPRAVSFEPAPLLSWDTSLLLAVRRVDGVCRARGVSVALDGLPAGARRLLALADAVREKPRPPGMRPT